MEPTIYKPSIYKGAGIYKTGAEGGGGGGPDLSGYKIYEYFKKNGNSRAYNMMNSGSSFCECVAAFLAEIMSNHRYSIKMEVIVDNSTLPTSEQIGPIQTSQSDSGNYSNFKLSIFSSGGSINVSSEFACDSNYHRPRAAFSTPIIGDTTDLDIIVSNEKMVVNGVDCSWSHADKSIRTLNYIIAPYGNTYNDYNNSKFESLSVLYNDDILSKIVPAMKYEDSHLGWLDVKTAEFYDNNDYNCWDIPT